jgi:hypothetical protein
MRYKRYVITFILLFAFLLIFSPINFGEAENAYIFYDGIDSGKSFKWKFTKIDYQVPKRWSLESPPFEKGDSISIIMKDDPANFPFLVGYYFQYEDVKSLLDFYKNDTSMSNEEFRWFTSIFGKTPFPFLPITYRNETGLYNYLDLYYLTLKEIEGIETFFSSTGYSSYNYTIKLETVRNSNYLNIYEMIEETSDLNTTDFYYLQYWNYYTEIKINLKTGLVEEIGLVVRRNDSEILYAEDTEYEYTANIVYNLKLVNKRIRNIVLITSSIFTLVIFSVFSYLIPNKRVRKEI